jgi:hypothetical protein
MKKFIKENWLKLIAGVGVFLVCLSISYYFIIIIPKGKNEQKYLENQIKCQEAGNKLYKAKVDDGKVYGFNYYDPEYKFNKELNTCLSQFTHMNDRQNYEVSEIFDVYKNKVIGRHNIRFWNDKWEDHVGTEEEWKLQVDKLFKE